MTSTTLWISSAASAASSSNSNDNDGPTRNKAKFSKSTSKSTESSTSSTLHVQGQECRDAMGQVGIYTGSILVEKGIPHGNGELKYRDDENDAQNDKNAAGSAVASYRGDWRQGHWHGQGVCLLRNGDVYTGSFVAHERQGRGEYTWASQRQAHGALVKQRSYQGDFSHNQRHGHGTYTWRTTDYDTGELVAKSTYTGGFVQGLRQGQGVFQSASLQYTGEWYQGQYHGYGVLEDLKKHTLYRGYLEQSKKQGQGSQVDTSTNPPSLIHDGLWLDDQPFLQDQLPVSNNPNSIESKDDASSVASFHVLSTPQMVKDALGFEGWYKGIIQGGLPQGVGTMTYLEGYELDNQQIREYEGFWQKGHKHGFGRLQYTNGDAYAGNLVQDIPDGPGEYSQHLPHSSGGGDRLYKGVFAQGVLHGQDKDAAHVVYPNGDVYTGDYVHGQKHGSGKMEFADDGSVYEGDFQHGMYHGQGRLATPTSVYVGRFARGIFHGTGCLTQVAIGMQPATILYEGEWKQGQPVVAPTKTLTYGHLQIPHPPLDDPFVVDSDKNALGGIVLATPAEVQKSRSMAHTKVEWQRGDDADSSLQSLPQLVRRLSPLPQILPVPKGTLPPSGTSMSSHVVSSSTVTIPKTSVATTPAPPTSSQPGMATSLTSSILSTFMGSSDNTGTPSKTSSSKTKQDDQECKAVVDVSVWDGQENPGKYTGLLHVKSQRPHGVGRMVYQDGNRIHEGFWEYGHRQGHGRCLFVKIGDYHEGNYHKNLREGPGKYFWKDGRQFVGNYHEDERCGMGKFTYPNGDTYEGNFEKGQRQGQGIFIFGENSSKGKGQSKHAQLQALRYQGSWSGGVYNGMGRLEWKVSTTSANDKTDTKLHVYEGLFEKGAFHGAGIEMVDDQVLQQGIWEAGRFVQDVHAQQATASMVENDDLVDSFEHVQVDEVERQDFSVPNMLETSPSDASNDLEDDLSTKNSSNRTTAARETRKTDSNNLDANDRRSRENTSKKSHTPHRHTSSAECASTTDQNYELQRDQWRQSLEAADLS